MPRRFLAAFPGEKPLLRRGNPAAFEPDVFSRTNLHAKMKDSQKAVLIFGGDKRDRTADLLNAILGYTIFMPEICRIFIFMRNYRTFLLAYFMYFSVFLFQLRT